MQTSLVEAIGLSGLPKLQHPKQIHSKVVNAHEQLKTVRVVSEEQSKDAAAIADAAMRMYATFLTPSFVY